MTPQEKAEELVLNFFRIQDDVINHETTRHEAKQCALIAVDEVIKVAYWPTARQYWQEVKKEIKKL